MRRWKYGVLSFKGVADLDSKEWFVQLPFIIAVSVGAGFMGALFNLAHKHILKVRACCSINKQSGAMPLACMSTVSHRF